MLSFARRSLGLAVLALALATCRQQGTPAPQERIVGALLSLTGEWSSLGRSSEKALQAAVDDLNRRPGARWIRLVVEDTGLDPNRARDRLLALQSQGARLVIGPQSSGELQAIKAAADANGILVISHSSTAGSLAIPDDNVFRFCPADEHEGRAIAAWITADGVRTVVPVWRQGESNRGVVMALRPAYSGKVTDGVEYALGTTDFKPTVAALKAQVASAIAAEGVEAVGVFLAGVDEAASVLALARTDPELAAVKWYGNDGAAQSEAFLKDPAVAEFSAKVGFPCPLYGPPEAYRARWEPMTARLRIAPDGFALAAYDAMVVGVKALERVGDGVSASTMRRALMEQADDTIGLTGPTRLDAAGDRDGGDFDFWGIRDGRWQRVGTYHDGVLER